MAHLKTATLHISWVEEHPGLGKEAGAACAISWEAGKINALKTRLFSPLHCKVVFNSVEANLLPLHNIT